MKANKAKVYEWVFVDEGPYSNDQGDDGGMTTWGITHGEVKLWRKVRKVTEQDMRAFTQDEAKDIYDAWYWNPLRCDTLPSGLDYVIFDAGLLHGIDRAARWLQIACGAEIDGKIGANTIKRINVMNAETLIASVIEQRRKRARSHPDAKYFLRGWTNRINRCEKRARTLIDG